ncbi:hypothetical protein [Actinoallomurus sp. CA-150999]|uniref:hypothetical protein n=1 Tax=Actinoallomurus sp. CA-150999 TaxID=3239887 RepID=UPI003D922748
MKVLRRLLATLACLLPVVTGIVVIGSGTAYALGPGRICMFNAPSAVLGAGHVGWAFEVGTSGQWVFGATDDNAAGDYAVPPGQYNGAWTGSGDFTAARNTFRDSSIGYTRYRCKNTPTSAVGGATQLANDAKNWGYTAFGNNCLDHAWTILTAYRGGEMPDPWSNIIPNNFFGYGLDDYGWERIVLL